MSGEIDIIEIIGTLKLYECFPKTAALKCVMNYKFLP